MRYDYKVVMRQDVRDYMVENETELVDMDRDGLYQFLMDNCFDDDSITGNRSGSYTCNRFYAKENVIGDDYSWSYLADAKAEGFITEEKLGHWILSEDWESIDVVIRCYLLSQVIGDILDNEWF